MKNLIVIGHTNEKSFCYNGIMKTIKRELQKHDEEIEIIDLYRDNFHSSYRKELIKRYKKLVTIKYPTIKHNYTKLLYIEHTNLFTYSLSSKIIQLLQGFV